MGCSGLLVHRAIKKLRRKRAPNHQMCTAPRKSNGQFPALRLRGSVELYSSCQGSVTRSLAAKLDRKLVGCHDGPFFLLGTIFFFPPPTADKAKREQSKAWHDPRRLEPHATELAESMSSAGACGPLSFLLRAGCRRSAVDLIRMIWEGRGREPACR